MLFWITATQRLRKQYDCRQNSNREVGFIELKTSSSQDWEKKWFIFEDYVLKYGDSSNADEDDFIHIPMDQVVNLRTDVRKDLW